jgi:hypothetical protein
MQLVWSARKNIDVSTVTLDGLGLQSKIIRVYSMLVEVCVGVVLNPPVKAVDFVWIMIRKLGLSEDFFAICVTGA